MSFSNESECENLHLKAYVIVIRIILSEKKHCSRRSKDEMKNKLNHGGYNVLHPRRLTEKQRIRIVTYDFARKLFEIDLPFFI